uniref:Glucosamine 6-phosphate N-acetyltransferase n=1 Tax=Trieres chinensis TaxID=1514140 RepID=A0A7S1ZIJ1_TRICV
MNVQLRHVACPEDMEIVRSIRWAVFVEEQGVPPEVEDDGRDSDARHILLFSGVEPRPVATGRVTILRKEAEHCLEGNVCRESVEAKYSRIAVVPGMRGKGLGKRIIRELENVALSHGVEKASLTPHHYLEKFYRDLGFDVVKEKGEIIVNHRCKLITMDKTYHR